MPGRGHKVCSGCGMETGPRAFQCPKCSKPFVIKGKIAKDTAPLSLPPIQVATPVTEVKSADFVGLPVVENQPKIEETQSELPVSDCRYELTDKKQILACVTKQDIRDNRGLPVSFVQVRRADITECLKSVSEKLPAALICRTKDGKELIIQITIVSE